MYIKKRQNLSLVILLAMPLSLVSCVSQPPILTTSTSLVVKQSTSPNGKIVSAKYNKLINSAKLSELVTIQQKEVKFEETYISALGHTCRKLSIIMIESGVSQGEDKNNLRTKRVVCKDKLSEEWYLIPQMTHQDNNNDIFVN